MATEKSPRPTIPGDPPRGTLETAAPPQRRVARRHDGEGRAPVRRQASRLGMARGLAAADRAVIGGDRCHGEVKRLAVASVPRCALGSAHPSNPSPRRFPAPRLPGGTQQRSCQISQGRHNPNPNKQNTQEFKSLPVRSGARGTAIPRAPRFAICESWGRTLRFAGWPGPVSLR